MILEFADQQLDALDRLDVDCLVLTAFLDDRPLRGLAGRVDWRLCGRLSSWMRIGFVDLAPGAALLMPMPADRLPMQKILLVGMGRRAEFDGVRFDQVCAAIFRHAAGIGVRDLAMAMPGRIGLDVALRSAVQGLGRAIATSMDAEAILDLRLTVLEGIDVQRELGEPLRDMARRLRASAQQALGVEEEAPDPHAIERQGDSGPRDWRRGMVRLPPAETNDGRLGDL